MTVQRSLCVLMLAALLLSPTRAGAEVWVESGPLSDRKAVENIAESLSLVPGGATVKVVRRFIKGSGWQFLLRVEGVVDAEAGGAVARSIQAAGGRGLVIEQTEGDPRILLDTGVAAKPGDDRGPEEPRIDSARQVPDARAFLKGAVRRHGGERGGLDVVTHAGSLVLAFRRELPIDDGVLVSNNRFYRVGEALRLEVEILEGPGSDSVTLVTDQNAAWVRTDAEPIARDPARAREVLARFSPESVLAIPLSFARDVAEDSAWADLSLSTSGNTKDGVVVVTPVEPGREGLQSAEFAADSHLLTCLRWSGPSGLLEFRFADYRETLPTVMVPWTLSIERNGQIVEKIQIERFEIDGPVDPEIMLAIGEANKAR